MNSLPCLRSKIASCDVEVVRYVKQLEAQNERLETKISKLEVQKLSDKNKIAALQREIVQWAETLNSEHHMKKVLTVDDLIQRLSKITTAAGKDRKEEIGKM